MKVGERREFTPASLGDDALAVANGEYTCFIKGALPNERVSALVTYVKKQVAYADARRIIQPSTDRVKPSCPYFERCGGCELQHMSKSLQLTFKCESFEKKLRKLGGLELQALCTPSPQSFGYRNKLQLPVRRVGGSVALGFFQRGSHKLVPIKHCILHGQWAAWLIQALEQYISQTGILPYDEKGGGKLRTAVARYIDGQLLLIMVLREQGLPSPELLIELLKSKFTDFGLFVSINEKDTNVILGESVYHVYGRSYIESTTCGLRFRLRPQSFFQVNDSMRDMLYSKAATLAKAGNPDLIIDAFCGTGVLTALLASEDCDTLGIEIDKSSVADARDNAALNGIKRIEFICGDVADVLPSVLEKYKGKRINIVCDPSRKGIPENALLSIAEAQPCRFVYISCNAATQARDLAVFLKACGTQEKSVPYSVEHCELFDQFPQTLASETLIVLSKKILE